MTVAGTTRGPARPARPRRPRTSPAPSGSPDRCAGTRRVQRRRSPPPPGAAAVEEGRLRRRAVPRASASAAGRASSRHRREDVERGPRTGVGSGSVGRLRQRVVPGLLRAPVAPGRWGRGELRAVDDVVVRPPPPSATARSPVHPLTRTVRARSATRVRGGTGVAEEPREGLRDRPARLGRVGVDGVVPGGPVVAEARPAPSAPPKCPSVSEDRASARSDSNSDSVEDPGAGAVPGSSCAPRPDAPRPDASRRARRVPAARGRPAGARVGRAGSSGADAAIMVRTRSDGSRRSRERDSRSCP